MSEALKPGWRRVKLGDVVTRINQLETDPEAAGYTRFLKVEHMDPERLSVDRWGDTSEEELPPTFRNVFKAGHVLYPSRNPRLRRTVRPKFDGICGEKTFVIDARNGLLQELLPFILQTADLTDFATARAIGSTNKHIRWKDLCEYEFALPPLEEQRRFFQMLTAVEKATEFTRELQSKLHRARRSALEETYFNPDNSGLTLDQITDIRSGGTPKRSQEEFWNGDIPWLSPKDMRSCTILDTSEHISEVALKECRTTLAPPSSIYIVVRGMILAHTFPIVRADRPMAFNQDVKAIVPKNGHYTFFIQGWLEWASYRLLRLVSETSHGTKRLETNQLLSLRIPKETLIRKEEVRRMLQDFDSAQEAVDKRLMGHHSLKAAILAKLGNQP